MTVLKAAAAAAERGTAVTERESKRRSLDHILEPVCDEHSGLLILGSFPSVLSRENGFYYGNPRNRFWPVLEALTGREVPEGPAARRAYLLENGIAVFDVIKHCTIIGSDDSSIEDVVVCDLSPILNCCGREIPIFTNGGKADQLYRKYLEPVTGIRAVRLPSTSPANAAWSLPRLVEAWGAEVGPYLRSV